jgi:hypothetical protein
MNYKGRGRKCLRPNLRSHPGIFLGILTKITNTLSKYCQSSDRDSNVRPLNYNAKAETFETTCSPDIFVFAESETHRLCGIVVRVLGYRSGGPGSIPGTTRKKK